MTNTSIRLLFAPKKIADFKNLKKHISDFDFEAPIETNIHFWLAKFHTSKYEKKTELSFSTSTILDSDIEKKIDDNVAKYKFSKNLYLNIILYIVFNE